MGRFRALPYAKALLTVVQKDCPQRLERVAAELDAVAEALAEVPDFERVLVTPTVASEKKTEVLDAVLDALATEQPTRKFLHVVQQHYRMQHLAGHRRCVSRVGRREPRPNARPDRDGNRARRVRARSLGRRGVRGRGGGDVVAEFSENPELLGGFRLQVGSRVFDGSLSGELNRLSKEIEIEQG